jgi:ABC-type protease/lipase transport system fused ATPase/permease subunit
MMANPNEKQGPDEITQIYRASRSVIVATAIFSALVNVLMLTGSLFMLQVYDRVLGSGSVPTLVALVGALIVAYVYYGFLEFVRSRLMVRMGRKVEEHLRARVFDAVTVHALRRTPGVGSQPLNDLATIRQYL